jgi:outer membrane protein OmpA-like peptidoglycan-associated protein
MRFWKSGVVAVAFVAAAVTPALADDAPGGTLVPGAQLAQMPPPPMYAVNWTGFYLGGQGGGDWAKFPGAVGVGTTPITAGVNPAPIPGGFVPLSSHVGGGSSAFTGGAQIGYNWQFPSNWMLGVELDGRAAGTAVTTTLGVSPPNAPPFPFVATDRFKASQTWNGSGRVRLGYAVGSVLPYVTAGVAFGDVNLNSTFIPVGVFPASTASRSSTLVGWTAGAGLEVSLTPAWSLGAEYRYADYGNTRVSLGQLATVTNGAGLFGMAPVSARVGVQSHTVVAKINYHFGAPPPPPPAPMAMPAPPPAAPVVFIVFFDWDKDTITPEGMLIVQQAADAYKSGAPVQIRVTGYTDRSGSAGYNQRLSERRANNVAKAMAALGVPPASMVVSGRGENDNRVPTADGVREPQNRRVEIIKS